MAAQMSRMEAREALQKTFEALLEKCISADESVPLRGRTFAEWEDVADEFDQAITGRLLEVRALLDAAAKAEEAGRCPHCSSTRVYLENTSDQVEVQSKHGVVVLPRQRCRCRACDRTFSPSKT